MIQAFYDSLPPEDLSPSIKKGPEEVQKLVQKYARAFPKVISMLEKKYRRPISPDFPFEDQTHEEL